MTGALILATTAALVVAVVLAGWRAHRYRYPDRPGRDDEPAVTAIRAPLAIEGKRP